MSPLDRIISSERMPLSFKVIRNVLISAVRVVLVWPIQFLLIPYILRKIGVEGYGTWALFLVVINLTSLADLGLSGTLTKHVAEHYARKDFKALNRLIDTGVVLYAVISLFAGLLLNSASPLLTGMLFSGSRSSAHELKILLMWVSFLLVSNLLGFPFYSALNGLQRMDLSNLVSYSKVVFGALLTVVFLRWGWGLRGLVYANLIAVLVALALSIWLVRRLLPEIGSYRFHFDREEVGHIFSFSLKMYVTQIAVAVDSQISKIYLGLFAGVQAAGWYNIASETSWKIRGIPELLLSPVMAAASELDARGDYSKLRELYFRSHKYLALFGVPLVLCVAFFSKRLVLLWLGANLGIVALPLSVLVIVYFFNLTSGPGYLILIGQSILQPGMKSAIMGLTLNLSLGLALVYFYGLWGGVLVTSISVVVGTAYFLYLFYKQTGISFMIVVHRAYLKPSVCALVLLTLLSVVSPVDHLGWSGLVLLGVLFGVLYLLGLALIRFFDEFDLFVAKRLFQSGQLARRVIPTA